MTPGGKHRAMLASAATASLLAAGLLGYVVVHRASWPTNQTAAPAVEVPTAAAGSSSPLELSVYDEPRVLAEIRFSDEQGQDLTLADFRGRVVLLNVWATWCVPCRKEMPALDRLQAKLGGDDFVVIPLSIDRKGVEAVKGFYREVGVKKLAVYLDPSGKGSRALAIPGVPTTLLIDRDGREVARKMGAAQWDGAEMVSLVERVIQGRSISKRDQAR